MYLDMRSLRRLTLVGEAHVSAKPEGVGLVVYTHLRGRGRESRGTRDEEERRKRERKELNLKREVIVCVEMFTLE